MESGSLIERSLLSNRAVAILSENRQITDIDRSILRDGLDLIDIIIQGKNQVSSGKLGDNSLDAANAYSSTIAALIILDSQLLPTIEVFIRNVRKQINEVINKNEVIVSDVYDAKTFFEALLTYTLNESSKRHYNKSEDTEWTRLLY